MSQKGNFATFGICSAKNSNDLESTAEKLMMSPLLNFFYVAGDIQNIFQQINEIKAWQAFMASWF